jgi:hypothetical protein
MDRITRTDLGRYSRDPAADRRINLERESAVLGAVAIRIDRDIGNR